MSQFDRIEQDQIQKIAKKVVLANMPTGGTGTVTSITAGSGLTGGTITTSGTIALDTTDAFGTKTNQALVLQVHNDTAYTLYKGQAVYVVGQIGQRIKVDLANANSEATSATTLGIMAETVASNGNGYVQCVGELGGWDTNHLSDGTPNAIWLAAWTGSLGSASNVTSTRPTQPNHGVALGWCLKQSPGASGQIYAKVTNGQELNEIHDVLISGTATGDVLSWDSSNLWKNKTLSAAGIAAASHTHPQSDITNLVTDLAGKAATSHVHAATDVTSGVFNIARIPTGTTSTTVSLGNHTHTAAGSNAQVQYNNATAIAGATNVNIDANNLRLLDTSITSASSSGGLTMFSKKFNLFHYPAWMDERGQWRNTQVCVARSRVGYWYGQPNGTTALTGVGLPSPTQATASTLTARNLATGNFLASTHRIGCVSAATAAGRAGWRSSIPLVSFSSSSGCGGCHIVCRFIVSDATTPSVSGARLFIGLSATSTEFAAATEVNTLFNLVGFGQMTSAANPNNIYIVNNDGAGTATSVDTGYTLSQTDVLEATFQTIPGSSSLVGYRLDNLSSSSTIVEGTLTTDLPVDGSLLYFHMFRTNGSTAQAVALDCLQTYFEFPG